jgi:DNA-binding beta-propeller fold protein YncE
VGAAGRRRLSADALLAGLRLCVTIQITPFARNLALSPDQQWLYVGDGKEIAVVDRKSLTIVGAINPPGMIGAGHQIATDSKGNLYIVATGTGMQKPAFKGMSTAATR